MQTAKIRFGLDSSWLANENGRKYDADGGESYMESQIGVSKTVADQI